MNTRTTLFIRRGLLLLLILALVSASFVYGLISERRQNQAYRIARSLLSHRKKVLPKGTQEPDGRWSRIEQQGKAQGRSEEEREAARKLAALPYLQGYNPAPAADSVTIHQKAAAYPGLNFVLSADAPRAVLMDMDGKVLHEWSKRFEEVWPVPPEGIPAPDIYKTYWRRAYPLENGDLLAIFMGFGLIRLDKDSKLLWVYEGGCHHDLFIDADGNIHVLTRERKTRDDLYVEGLLGQRPILEDFITVVSPEGKEVGKLSVIDCLLNSPYAPLLEHARVGDLLHTNTVQPILADRPPLFRKGQILISMRNIHTIAALDPERKTIDWAATGMWKYQHEPRLLKNGNVLLFDNRGNRGRSQAIEFDPLTQQVVWTYRGKAGETFYSRESGSIQRLPNGNTLITESEKGRGLEVTQAGEIVWEFLNPRRAGENGELIAALYDVIRLDQTQAPWLSADGKASRP